MARITKRKKENSLDEILYSLNGYKVVKHNGVIEVHDTTFNRILKSEFKSSKQAIKYLKDRYW